MASFRPLSYANVSTAYHFLLDCEDDLPCGLPGENLPARRPIAFGTGVYRQRSIPEDGLGVDRVESFEDAVIAHLDGELDELLAEAFGTDDDEPAALSYRFPWTEAANPIAPVRVTELAPADQLLPDHAGMHRALGAAPHARRVVRRAA